MMAFPRSSVLVSFGIAVVVVIIAVASWGSDHAKEAPPKRRLDERAEIRVQLQAALGNETLDADQVEALLEDISSTDRGTTMLRATSVALADSIGGGAQCSNTCYFGLGFGDGDCECSRHEGWYMWICSSYRGAPMKKQFCGSGHCTGCKAPAGAAPLPVPAPAPSPLAPTPTVPGPAPAGGAVAEYGNCISANCQAGYTCFEKDGGYAQCRTSCLPGVHFDEPKQFQQPWSCKIRLAGGAGPVAPPTPPKKAAGTPVPAQLPPVAPAPTPAPASASGCADPTADFGECTWTNCCASAGFKCFSKDSNYAQCRKDCVAGLHSDEPAQFQQPWSCALKGGADSGSSPSPGPDGSSNGGSSGNQGDNSDKGSSSEQPKEPKKSTWAPENLSLLQASSAPTYTFYMYRAQGGGDYPPENQNMANLPGLMWYLHNEIVNNRGERRFRKTRIQRFKVQTKATEALVKAGMNFGTRFAFDQGRCTGPFNCTKAFEEYGFAVGCNKVDEWPTKQWADRVFYTDATWYSLPGKCSSQPFYAHDEKCIENSPGGACEGTPNGNGTCTYSYEKAGEITIDSLEGISSFSEFAGRGGWEYNNQTDHGVLMSFWDNKNSEEACRKRTEKADKLFKDKYPEDPSDAEMKSPICDFRFSLFYGDKVPAKEDWEIQQEARENAQGSDANFVSTFPSEGSN